jgi:predicted SnoaL-like aldol condensation-catalyzing enzyme
VSTEQNKAVVRRFLEASLNNMDTALVDELFSPDYVNHMVPGGREAFKQFIPMLRSAYPDLKFHNTIEHMVAEGDYVMARVSFHYTNAGKEASASDLSEYRLSNGKIVEDWPPTSSADILQKVGITLPTG